MSTSNRGLWIGIIAIIVVAALGWWWVAANQAVATPTAGTSMATSSAATSTASSGSSSAMTERSNETVKSIIASLASASEYDSLFVSTGVAGTIGSGGQFTVFVPTNTAFANLPKGTITKMSAAQLKRLVQYSIVNGRAIQPGTGTSGSVQAYSGDSLNFSDLNNIPMVNSSIITAEYKGSNGVVYLITAVLLPPQK